MRGDDDGEVIPAAGKRAGNFDFLNVAGGVDLEFSKAGFEAGGEGFTAAHDRLAGLEEDDVLGHEVKDGGNVALASGGHLGGDEVADGLGVVRHFVRPVYAFA